MGYAGGTRINPTYHNLGDHTETIQIDFDPKLISYEELLQHFWSGHQADRPAWSQQYASLILYGNQKQRELAEKSKASLEAKQGHRLYTRIAPLEHFYLAEDYHQKYQLRNSGMLSTELMARFARPGDFINSTAAARVNGYLAGMGSPEQFEKELPLLGLSPKARERLRKSFKSSYQFVCN